MPGAVQSIGVTAYRSLLEAGGAVEVGGVVCLRTPLAPDSPMVNRIVGLGVDRPTTEAELDEAIAAMGELTFYVSVEPEALPPALPDWLAARGLEPSWGWMRFERGNQPAPLVATALEIKRIGPEQGAEFARIQRIAYDLPEAIEPVLATVPSTPGWSCWIGYDGATPAAAGGLYADGRSAYFGLGATLPEHRGKGGQSAIFAARIEHARALGCTTLLTETGERRGDRPSNSYRNITRFGFEERDVLANWLRRRP
jgi:GNAT superfamily N-acetyltransferase